MKKRNKLLALLMVLAMTFTMAVPVMAAEAEDGIMTISAVPEDIAGKTVILHTNDAHGAIEGYAKVAALKAEYEAAGANVLLMDAGDFSQGETFVSVSEGAAAIELMNMAGYDVAAPGNHEFDYGYAQLKNLIEAADFPVLAANIKCEDDNVFGSHIVLTAGETKVGVFGLTTPETATKAHPAKIAGLIFVSAQEMYTLAQAEVDALKAENCDYIICLSHMGIDEESAREGNRSIDLLNNVTGIDIFIDGHSHSTLEQVQETTGGTGKVGDTYLTSTGTKLASVGVVILDGETIIITSVSTEDITVAEDDAIAARAREIQDEIRVEYGATFATSAVNLNGDRDPGNRTEETNLGDLIADAMLWYATKDGGLEVDDAHVVTVTNGGSVRASIEAGDISKNSVNAVMPFGNTVTIIYVTGTQLLEALEASTYCTPTAVGGFPQISGMNITIDTTREFAQGDLYPNSTYHAPASINRVTINSVNGSPFSLTDTYAVVSNDFCAAGGDTYYAFSTATVMDTGTPLDEAMMQYITTVLDGAVDEQYLTPAGRITVIASEATEPEQSEPASSIIYVVIPGDSLWCIAQRQYGSGSLWCLIYDANQDTINDPSRIWVGQTLNIPTR
ncbi:MAG: LysM peptidoglycan-binding domain-containing protein [Lachnospiraceae bacterium]|nr:LysM peptidoglycan-binding domain-containing protein [Lachnospiraceae bacterium]